jgi:hypothetical protein
MSKVLIWFNSAPTIQTVAALASVLIAVVLVAVTWTYVQVTRELASAARHLLDF